MESVGAEEFIQWATILPEIKIFCRDEDRLCQLIAARSEQMIKLPISC